MDLPPRRILMPKPLSTNSFTSGHQVFAAPSAPPLNSLPRKAPGPKTATKTNEEWELQKPNFVRLYVEQDLPLPEVMNIMAQQHNFIASRKQYNTKIVEWRVGKNVKDNEMRAIIRKEQKRKNENPPKESTFRVRKYNVNPSKIARFKREKGITDENDMMLDAGTPSDISCDTPRLQNRELSPEAVSTLLRATPSPILPSAASPMTSYSPYFGLLSPSLQEPFSVPYLDQSSASPTLPKHSPVLRQPSPLHASSRIASPNQVHRGHQSSANSLRQRTCSPIYWRTSPSPVLTPAQISNVPSSIADLKNTASNLQQFVDPTATILRPRVSHFDWYQPFMNFRNRSMSPRVTPPSSALINLLRTYVIDLDTYEAEMQKQNLDVQLSVTEQGLIAYNINEDCRICMVCAKNYLQLCKCEEASCKMMRSRYVLDYLTHNLSTHLQLADSDSDSDPASFWSDLDWISLTLGYQRKSSDSIKILQIASQEFSNQGGLNTRFKKVISLRFANAYIYLRHYDMAEKQLRDVLKEDFLQLAKIVSSCAEMDLFRHSANKRLMNIAGMDEDEMTSEGLAYLEIELGKERMAEKRFYIFALRLIYKLHWYRNRDRVVEVTDEQGDRGVFVWDSLDLNVQDTRGLEALGSG